MVVNNVVTVSVCVATETHPAALAIAPAELKTQGTLPSMSVIWFLPHNRMEVNSGL